jgi:hypothetical protein
MTDEIEDYFRARQAGAPQAILYCTHEPTLLTDAAVTPNSNQGQRHLLLEDAKPSDKVVVREGAPLDAVYRELIGAALEDDCEAFYERFNEAMGVRIIARLRQMRKRCESPSARVRATKGRHKDGTSGTCNQRPREDGG